MSDPLFWHCHWTKTEQSIANRERREISAPFKVLIAGHPNKTVRLRNIVIKGAKKLHR
jgi:hypothetical protein